MESYNLNGSVSFIMCAYLAFSVVVSVVCNCHLQWKGVFIIITPRKSNFCWHSKDWQNIGAYHEVVRQFNCSTDWTSLSDTHSWILSTSVKIGQTEFESYSFNQLWHFINKTEDVLVPALWSVETDHLQFWKKEIEAHILAIVTLNSCHLFF